MSVIKVTLPPGEIPAEGKQVSFKAPCPCDVTDGIQIEGVTYTVCDALGKCVTGIGGVWDVGSIVTVTLSLEQKKAYVQNNAGYSPSNKPTLADVIGSNENLIDNWYFADPVYQRESRVVPPGVWYYDTPTFNVAFAPTVEYYYASKVSDTAYAIKLNNESGTVVYVHAEEVMPGYVGEYLGYLSFDRWYSVNTHPIVVVDKANGYATLSTRGIGWNQFWHKLENPPKGKTVTLSILTTSGLSCATARDGASTEFALDDYWRFGYDATGGVVWFTGDPSVGGKSINIIAVKLELGSVQTLAHQDTNGNWVLNDPPPDKGVEMLKCATAMADSTDTFANMGAGATKTITATLSTSWTASGNYFYQDVAVSGLLVTDTPIVGVNPGSDNAANVNYSMGFSNVFRITTSANSIRAWARSKPTVAIPIQIKVVR